MEIINKDYNNNFCLKQLERSKSKCNSFYLRIVSEDDGFHQCPYGYSCYKKGYNVICSLINKYSDLSALKRRDKYNKTNYNKYMLFNEISDNKNADSFVKYQQYLELSNYIIHDLGNALNYLLDLKNYLSPKYNDIVTDYNKIVDAIKTLRECSIRVNYLEFLTKHIDGYSIKSKIDDLNTTIGDSNIKVRKYLDDDLSSSDRTCLEGITLLNTLIERNLKAFGYIEIDTKYGSLKLHKMILKLKRLLSQKSSLRNINIRISHEQDIEIFNIPDIYIALFTLLDNAIKYASSNSTIEIYFAEKLNEYIKIIIENESEPINEEEMQKLFNKGYRGSNSKNGNGLGLYLVKTISDASHSMIEANYSNGIFQISMQIPDLI